MNSIDISTITENAHKCLSQRYSGIREPTISQDEEYRRIAMDVLTYTHVYNFEKQRWDKMMEIDNFKNKDLENYKERITNEFKEIYNHFQNCYRMLDKSGLVNDRLNEMRETFRSYRVYIDNQQPINNNDRVVNGSKSTQRYPKRQNNSSASDKEKAKQETAHPIHTSDGKWQNRGRGYGRNNTGGRGYGRNNNGGSNNTGGRDYDRNNNGGSNNNGGRGYGRNNSGGRGYGRSNSGGRGGNKYSR